MSHQPRLTQALHALVHSLRAAALGTLTDDGNPFVSMVPFAIEPALGMLVIHVSALAAHTRHLQKHPRVSLLIMQPELPGAPVHALPRVTLEGEAVALAPDSAEWRAARSAYLQRFPEAEPMTQLGDFRFMAIQIRSGRHIAGFGAARDVDAAEVKRVLRIVV